MKWGIRVEPYAKGLFLGIGFTWFVETALQIDMFTWSISIGRVHES